MSGVLNYALLALVFVAWLGLFAVKDAARDAAGRADELERQIAREEARVEALLTDWAILNEPGRLQALAQTHLGLEATDARQIVTMSALPPVPLNERREPGGGTFLAAARGYQQLAPRRERRIDPYADWARPVLRPNPGR